MRKAISVFGELLITVGILLLLFVGYKAIVQDQVVASDQTNLAKSYEKKQIKFVEPVKAKTQGDVFAQMYVPRFGDTWTRLIGQGTRWHPTLNTIGVGHYLGTAMPGEVGNFAVAAHRGGFGGAFRNIDKLQTGDRVYVKTKSKWFVYKFLQSKVVPPADLDVISEVPQELDVSRYGGRYMTMTSCTPIWVNTDRYIVWLELESTSKEAPAEMAIHER